MQVCPRCNKWKLLAGQCTVCASLERLKAASKHPRGQSEDHQGSGLGLLLPRTPLPGVGRGRGLEGRDTSQSRVRGGGFGGSEYPQGNLKEGGGDPRGGTGEEGPPRKPYIKKERRQRE